MDKTEAEKSVVSREGSSAKPRGFNVRVTAFGLAACAIGLLLWSRLILVTNHPRTAIAEPPVVQPGAPKHGIDTPQSKQPGVDTPGDLANGRIEE